MQDYEEVEKFRSDERAGVPLGADSFIARLKNILGRMLCTKGLKGKIGISKIKYGVPGSVNVHKQ